MKLLQWIYKLFNKPIQMPENSVRIQEQVNYLNTTAGVGWIAIPGYFAMTGFSYGQPTPTFNPTYGYPVKLFVNQTTGEMRMYPASIFETINAQNPPNYKEDYQDQVFRESAESEKLKQGR